MMKKLLFDEIARSTPAKSNIISRLNTYSKKSSKLEAQPSGNFGWRSLIFLLLLLIVLFTFVSRAIKLQLIDSGKYIRLADSNKTRNSLILAERGVIYSSNGEILARNKPAFAVELNTSLCGEVCPKIVSKLSEFIELDSKKIAELFASNRSELILANNLDKDKILLIEANLYQLPGVSVIVYPIRDYIEPFVFAHSVGYVGLDDKSLQPKIVGKSGIEQTYNEFLTGIDGSRMSQVDSTGKKYTITAQEDALPGRDITLYLNKALSVKAYELLKKLVDDKKADAGVVVAQDPQTGGVLALVSYPSFDPNKLSLGLTNAEYTALINDPSKPFFNRAISAAYPPGSTFKMITASAALSEGTVDRYTTIFDPGYLVVNGFRFNNWKLEGHGDVNLVRALQVSNDTFFYTIGGGYGNVKGVGIEKLNKWAKRFGTGIPTQIDLAGEVEGYMPDGVSREWYLGDTYITSIGQGDVLTTPLQINVVTSYFANGGKILKPQVIKSVSGKNTEPQIVSQGLISKKNYELIREGLSAAVKPGGTAYPVFDFPTKYNGIELGGKTGTSEYINKQGKPSTHAWFTVFGPLDRASIALTVFLEGGGSGSDDAAPVARQLLDLWFE